MWGLEVVWVYDTGEPCLGAVGAGWGVPDQMAGQPDGAPDVLISHS